MDGRIRLSIHCACAFVLLATQARAWQTAVIPVKRIVLYKHGIGLFERAGVVGSGDQVRLDFKSDEMSDILKSLTITDQSGGRITSVRYDSNQTLDQKLEKYAVRLGNQERLSALLDSMKGARIELKSGERSITGAIVGARALEAGPNSDKHIVQEQVTVLLESGEVATFDLAAIGVFRLLDPDLQNQLKQYLANLSESRARNRRSLYIDSAREGERNYQISYIAPAAIWKSTYRLALSDTDARLEGWAVVDNTTDEDWTDVKLAVVSGRPISFISELDVPRYGRREVVELPEDRAAGPVVYGGGVTEQALGTGSGSGSGSGVFKQLNGGGGGARIDGAPKFQPGAGLSNNETFAKLEMSSSVEGATGETVGELFEYNFANPISIKKNQSAMLPFLLDKIAARKLLIYTQGRGEHPVNSAEVTNSTGKTLDGGPITVYDSGAYAGEALFETLKASDKRLIGYAVDYGTRITTSFGTSAQAIREIHVKNGVLQLRYAEHQTTTYAIRNVDTKPKTLIVEHPGGDDYAVLSPKPAERTASAYRFEVRLPANSSQVLKVEQEHPTLSSVEISSAAPDFLLKVVTNQDLRDSSRRSLEQVANLKSQLADVAASLQLSKSQLGELTEDQTRLRQNVDSLNRVKGQEDPVRKYSAQIAENELQIVKLRDQRRELEDRKSSLDLELRRTIEKLSF